MTALAGGKGAFTKNDYAYAEVRRRILSGEFGPGAVVGQAALAAELGLSTTPLREALKRLAAEGLVILEAHRDARVSPITADEAEHLYEVRLYLDPVAASLAAQRRTVKDVDAITRALQAIRPISIADDLDAFALHREFHRAIHVAATNPILLETLDRLWDQADRYRIIGMRTATVEPTDLARVERQHQMIAEAVVDQQPELAAAIMREHIAQSHGRKASASLR
ncbi:MAG: GntR family transcriptional regulator [Tetrasphaera sp.]